MRKVKKLKKIVDKFLDDVCDLADDDHEVISILVCTIDIFTENGANHRPCLLRHASQVIQKIEQSEGKKPGEVWH
jgi:hypothetical protein